MDRHAAGRSNMRLRGMVSAVLAFLASLFLSLLVLLLTLQTTLLSPAFMKKQVDNSRYIPHIIEDMESVFVSYGMSSNFNEAFFTSVLDATAVKSDVDREIEKLYDPDAPGADTEAFEAALLTKLQENVEARGVEVTQDVREALVYLASMCADSYQEGVQLPLASYASGVLAALQMPVLIGILVLAALSVFVLGYLYRLRRRKSQSCRFAIYALSGAVLTVTIPSLFVWFSGRIDRIGITGKALYYFITTYIRGVLSAALLFAAVLAAAVIVLALLYHRLRRREARSSGPPVEDVRQALGYPQN